MSDQQCSKDEILANFQACTGIEDYGKALSQLEECNWDLIKAINKVYKEHNHISNNSSLVNDHNSPSSSFHHPFFTSGNDPDVIEIDSPDERSGILGSYSRPGMIPHPMGNTVDDNFGLHNSSDMSIPSTSNPQPDVIDINLKIKYEESDEENCPFPVEIPESTTYGEFQTVLHQLLGIPPCSQVLNGFQKAVYPDTAITRDVLPKNRSLTLVTSSEMTKPGTSYTAERDSTCNLLIYDEKNKKEYTLSYNITKPVKEIKNDVFGITNIPVRHQVWTGWPSDLIETSTLQSIGMPKESHLTVAQCVGAERTPKLQHKSMRDVSEENSSGEEYEDASELLPEEEYLLLEDTPSSQSNRPLIPVDVGDEMAGVLSFTEEFQNRFGSMIPIFYQGKLEDALKESVMLPAKNRKLLALYVHHDKSVLANVFCTQTLCSEAIVDFLSTNYLIWGWDITHDSNKQKLMSFVSTHLGSDVLNSIKCNNLEKLPVLLLLNKSRGSVEILGAVNGNLSLDEVMTLLMQANEIFEEQRRTELVEENRREQRETVMAEQDAAYNASLEMDRAKEQAKRFAELAEKEEREKQQNIREREEQLREALRFSLEQNLPPEPTLDCEEPTAILKFRSPKGEHLTRKFTKSTPLQVVLNYLTAKGYPPDEFKCIRSFPRICLTVLDPKMSLSQLDITNRENFNIEERTGDKED